MIRAVENLVVGDTFKIGDTPVVVAGFARSSEFRNTHIELSLMTLYSDGGRTMKMTLEVPRQFLVELFET